MPEEFYITAVEVKHYAYCPKIVYFTHVLHLEEPVTDAMKLGGEMHDEALITPLLRLLKVEKLLRGVELVSERLRLSGKVDYLAITKFGEYVPIEVKWAEPTPKGRPKKNHRLQLAAYALLIEENFKTVVKRFAIYYARAHRAIISPIDSSLKREAHRAIKNIHEIIVNEEEPKVRVPKSRCENCGYRRFCQP